MHVGWEGEETLEIKSTDGFEVCVASDFFSSFIVIKQFA